MDVSQPVGRLFYLSGCAKIDKMQMQTRNAIIVLIIKNPLPLAPT